MSGSASAVDRRRLAEAIELARACPPSATAFSVGALVVAADGTELGRGHSRQADPAEHAEEVALAAAAGDPRLAGATAYTSLEPCARRASRPRSCTDLLLAAGVARVVFAAREPGLFVPGADGAQRLAAAGVTVVEVPELAAAAHAAHAHLDI